MVFVVYFDVSKDLERISDWYKDGVVSGVVIKKKQVEKGFDALHCAVGGQTIADWGDEFIVGMSK